ncbi:MAG: PorT family protein [Chlorobi bacterium]|nr:PorT family protein [Chlorobiota bacterium]
MKKFKALLTLAVIVSVMTVHAQEFRIGLSMAPTISFNKAMVKVDNQYVIVDSLKSGGLGFKGGLWADYGFAKNYYLHTGLLIHSKNFSSDAYNMRLTTVEVPLALKMRTNEVTDNIRILGFFGATLDFNVSAKQDNRIITDEIKKLGASLIFGAGAEYYVGFGNINLGLSYHLGMTDVMAADVYRTIPKHLSIDFAFYFN